jgi:hypothetical protein
MVIALIALFVAMGGSTYAAVNLPANSIGTKHLKNGAVTALKVKKGSLLASNFKPGQLPKGPKGDAGPTGPPGPKGDTGVPGATGAKGDAGATGATGPQGSTGERGPMGPQGPAGPQGAPGPKGNTGSTGPQGPQGDAGATGPMGPSNAWAIGGSETGSTGVINLTAGHYILNYSATIDNSNSVFGTTAVCFVRRLDNNLLVANSANYGAVATGNSASIAGTLGMDLSTPLTIRMDCQKSAGNGNFFPYNMQMTVIRVATLN